VDFLKKNDRIVFFAARRDADRASRDFDGVFVEGAGFAVGPDSLLAILTFVTFQGQTELAQRFQEWQ
jgi:hypothetical protein